MPNHFFRNRNKRIFQIAIVLIVVFLVIANWLSDSYTPDYEGFCPFGGILSLGSKLWRGSMSCSMSETQIFMGLALVISVILIGKLFCGYLCPIGSVIDWLRKLVGNRFSLHFAPGKILDRVLRSGKYILLFFVAYYTITSSELWCKKFDPYFASVTGFGADTVLLWGILSLVAVLIVSVLVRFFWCKYVCPLGALSNIFANILITAPLIVIYIVLRALGVELHILWLILALCLSGALTEILRFRFFSITTPKIEIDPKRCTGCSLCDRDCPQGIEVSKYEKVTHPDCTLCLDCVHSCKTEGGIRLGKHNRSWFPVIAILSLFIIALFFSKIYEFKTISERWGNYERLAPTAKFEIENLKTVKCFGSAKSLQNQLMRQKGIVGLDAYAKSHRVVIYYDIEQLDSTGVKQAVFRPSKYKLNSLTLNSSDSLAIFQIGIEGLWDLYDNAHLVRMLRQNKAIHGFATQFGEPVIARIYYDADHTQPADIIALIEAKSYKLRKGDEIEEVAVDFECERDGQLIGFIDRSSFLQNFFSGYDQSFNHYNQYEPLQLKVFEIGLPNAESRQVRLDLRYLSSHVSFHDGIVRLRTVWHDRPVLQIYYDPAQVDSSYIHQRLSLSEMEVLGRDGNTFAKENRFQFDGPVLILDNK